MEQLQGSETALSPRQLGHQALVQLLDQSGGELRLSVAGESLADELGVRKLDAAVIILEAPDLGPVEVDLMHGYVRKHIEEPARA